MLIQPHGRDRTDYRPAPKQMKPKDADAPELLCKSLPDGTDGRRIPTPQELFDMMKDPKMRTAVSVVERAMGAPTALRVAIAKQFKRDAASEMALRVQVRALHLAEQKAEDKRRKLI